MVEAEDSVSSQHRKPFLVPTSFPSPFRWVQEKGHLKCEVCEQQYRGTFILPPPPQPSSAEAAAMERLQLLIHDPATGHEALDLLDESDRYYRRNPGMSWCFSVSEALVFWVCCGLLFCHRSEIQYSQVEPSMLPPASLIKF